MAEDLDTTISFAHPYASWERGLNENTNGLSRQYFPKPRELTTVTTVEITQAMNQLNHRPRTCLGFRTPYEIFFNTKTTFTVDFKVESKLLISSKDLPNVVQYIMLSRLR